MTPTTALPGSRVDRQPLITCNKCQKPSERSGGVFYGTRFACRACYASKGKR
jgi:hypothetical protein